MMKNKTLKFWLDFGPLLAFLGAYYYGGIMLGTGALIVATAFALTVHYMVYRRIAWMLLTTALIVTFFGGLTLYFNDERFIKMKPTILNILFGAALLGGLPFHKYFLKRLMGKALQMKDKGWYILTKRWGLFFFALALLNELVWRNFSTEFWVTFKVFGLLGLSFIFILTQAKLMEHYQIATKE